MKKLLRVTQEFGRLREQPVKIRFLFRLIYLSLSNFNKNLYFSKEIIYLVEFFICMVAFYISRKNYKILKFTWHWIFKEERKTFNTILWSNILGKKFLFWNWKRFRIEVTDVGDHSPQDTVACVFPCLSCRKIALISDIKS